MRKKKNSCENVTFYKKLSQLLLLRRTHEAAHIGTEKAININSHCYTVYSCSCRPILNRRRVKRRTGLVTKYIMHQSAVTSEVTKNEEKVVKIKRLYRKHVELVIA